MAVMEKHRAWLRGKDVLKKHKVMRMVRVDWINHFEKYRPNLEQCLADSKYSQNMEASNGTIS